MPTPDTNLEAILAGQSKTPTTNLEAIAKLAGISVVTNTAPTVNDDSTLGYQVGRTWLNTATGTLYVCTDNTAGAALWTSIAGGGGGVSSVSGTAPITSSGGATPAIGATTTVATADTLVKRDGTGKLPADDGSALTGLTKTQVGLSNVDNTSDAGKPVSTAQQAALDLKAPLASPTLTGVPAAPTAAPATNTTQLATTAFVIANAAQVVHVADRAALLAVNPTVVGTTYFQDDIFREFFCVTAGTNDMANFNAKPRLVNVADATARLALVGLLNGDCCYQADVKMIYTLVDEASPSSYISWKSSNSPRLVVTNSSYQLSVNESGAVVTVAGGGGVLLPPASDVVAAAANISNLEFYVLGNGVDATTVDAGAGGTIQPEATQTIVIGPNDAVMFYGWACDGVNITWFHTPINSQLATSAQGALADTSVQPTSDLVCPAPQTLTISGGVLTLTSTAWRQTIIVNGEGAVADTLVSISGGVAGMQLLLLRGDADITIEQNANFKTVGSNLGIWTAGADVNLTGTSAAIASAVEGTVFSVIQTS